MSIILYGARTSPFVEKVYRGLLLKQLPFQLQQPRLPRDLRRHNPVTGKMPALDLDGYRLFDSTLILRALNAYKPTPPLLDADPSVAVQQQLLEDWADESLYWYGMAFRWTIPANAARTVALVLPTTPVLLRPLVRLVVPRLIAAQVRAQGTGRLPVEVLRAELDGHLANLVTVLGAGPFFFGAERPSLADLAIFGQLSFLRARVSPETQAAVERCPALVDFYRRLDRLTA